MPDAVVVDIVTTTVIVEVVESANDVDVADDKDTGVGDAVEDVVEGVDVTEVVDVIAMADS